MQNPTVDAFQIAHAPPDFEFGDDFDRKPRPFVHPLDRMVLRRTLSQVDPVGLQTGVARQRQLGDRPDRIGKRQKRHRQEGEVRQDRATAEAARAERLIFSIHCGFPDSSVAVLVFAESSGREAGKLAVRDLRGERRRKYLPRAPLTRPKLVEIVGANV